MANIKTEFVTGRRNMAQPNEGPITKVPLEITLGATALALNDTYELFELQPGVQCVDFDVIAPQLDSNGTPTLDFAIGTLNAGKTNLDVTWGSALQAGRTANGSIARASDARAATADATATRWVALKVTTVAATYAGSGKKIIVLLHLKA